MLREVSSLIAKCPAPSANAYALAGYIDACRDYKTINDYVIEFLNNYCEYIDCKSLIRSGELSKEDAYYYKECAKRALYKLRRFVQKRTEEHWS